MVSPKIVAACLLFFSSCALARIQLHLEIEYAEPCRGSLKVAEKDITLMLNERVIVAESFGIMVEAHVRSEQDDKAAIYYSVSKKKKDDTYEQLFFRIYNQVYGQPLSIFQFKEVAEDIIQERFKISSIAVRDE